MPEATTAEVREAHADAELRRVQSDADGRAKAVNVLTLTDGPRGAVARLFLRSTELIDHGRRELAPFKFLHAAHFIVFRFPYVGAGQPREYHRYKSILFCANYNGGLHEYIERFLETIPTSIEMVWGGDPTWRPIYPNDERLKQIILNHSFSNLQYYSAYPQASRTEIDSALQLQRLIADFRHREVFPGFFRRLLQGGARPPLEKRFAEFIRCKAAPFLVPVPDTPGPDLTRERDALPVVVGMRSWLRWFRLGTRLRNLSSWILTQLDRLSFLGTFRSVLQWVVGASIRGWLHVGASDRNGRMRALAVLAPMRPEAAVEIRRLLETEGDQPLGVWPQRPFMKMPGLHFARLAIIDDRTFNAIVHARPRTNLPDPPDEEQPGKTEPHGLASSYLLFDAVFDRPPGWRVPVLQSSRREFIRELCARVPALVQLWEHCYGFPSPEARVSNPDAVLEWVERCRIYGARLYCDAPDVTVADVYSALEEQRAFVEFALQEEQPRADDIREAFARGFGRSPAARP
jgi:hypothetical protein